MKTITMPGTDIDASNIVLGLMRIPDMGDADVRALYASARENGITFFDHADIYGGAMHVCERRFAEALKLSDAERAEIQIQTKCGISPGVGFDFSEKHILTQVDGSLAALDTDYIDVLLLHRPDALVEPEEVAEAFSKLHDAGKVRNFGVSNHTPGQIDLLRSYIEFPLVANQIQLSITHCPAIAQGIAMNMAAVDQSISRDLGIVDYCRLHNITLQAWSPYQKGFFDGVFLGDRENYGPLNDLLDELAVKYGVDAMAIATAWITRHPANMQVVLGTTKPERVASACAGSDIPLTRAEWYGLFQAAGHLLP